MAQSVSWELVYMVGIAGVSLSFCIFSIVLFTYFFRVQKSSLNILWMLGIMCSTMSSIIYICADSAIMWDVPTSNPNPPLLNRISCTILFTSASFFAMLLASFLASYYVQIVFVKRHGDYYFSVRCMIVVSLVITAATSSYVAVSVYFGYNDTASSPNDELCRVNRNSTGTKLILLGPYIVELAIILFASVVLTMTLARSGINPKCKRFLVVHLVFILAMFFCRLSLFTSHVASDSHLVQRVFQIINSTFDGFLGATMSLIFLQLEQGYPLLRHEFTRDRRWQRRRIQKESHRTIKEGATLGQRDVDDILKSSSTGKSGSSSPPHLTAKYGGTTKSNSNMSHESDSCYESATDAMGKELSLLEDRKRLFALEVRRRARQALNSFSGMLISMAQHATVVGDADVLIPSESSCQDESTID